MAHVPTGQKAGSHSARSRIQKREVTKSSGKPAATQPWMGVRTKGPTKLSVKPKGAAVQPAKKAPARRGGNPGIKTKQPKRPTDAVAKPRAKGKK